MQYRVDLDKESPLNEPEMKRCKPSWDCPYMDMDMDITARAPRTGGRHQQSSTLIRSGDGSIEKGAEECSSSLPSILSSINHNRPATLSWCDSVHNSMQAVASGAHHHVPKSSAAYFHWPPSSLLQGTAGERASYFRGLQKDVHVHVQSAIDDVEIACGQQASTLLDLMTIRAFHSKRLRQYSLGTAIGFRTRGGVLTDIPAIVVFVARKVHKEWLRELQCLPPVLEGPGGIWCDVDVVEFSYYGTPALAPKEQVYTELVEGLRGNDACIGPGSQVANQETYGTLGAIVQSRTGPYQVGFLTNRHVAVDLDYPNQKMFHPLPPNLGPGVYLGAVERATSFITDDLWYGIFASMNPETFVRADGAFIPFGDCFDMSLVTTNVKGVGEMGDVMVIDLQAPVGSIVGKQVVKVGRSSGLTMGSIMAYALEYNDEKGVCFFTDFLIVGENKQAFDLEGDSGSLILMTDEDGGKSRPVGIIWGGTANRGCLKLHNGGGPENWTSGVDLGRLLDLLQLSLISSSVGLAGAAEEQRHWRGRPAGGESLNNEDGGCEMTSNSDTVTSLTEHPGGFQSQDLPITTLIDAYDPYEGAKDPNPHNRPQPSMELELLDFGFAPPDTLAEDREPSPHNTRAEELAFGLQLFDRAAMKTRLS